MVNTPNNPSDRFPPYSSFAFEPCQKCGNRELVPSWSLGPRFVFGFGTFNGEHLLWRCRCGYLWVTETLDNSSEEAGDFEGAFGPTGVMDLDNLHAPLSGVFARRPEAIEPTVPCAVCRMSVRAGMQFVKGPLAGYAFCDDHEPKDSEPYVPQFAEMLGEAKPRVRYHVGAGQGYATGRVRGSDGTAVTIEDDASGDIISRDPRRVTVLE